MIAVSVSLFARWDTRNREFLNSTKIRIHEKLRASWELVVKLEGEDILVNVSQSNGCYLVKIGDETMELNKEDINLADPLILTKINGNDPVALQLASRNAHGEYQIM